MENKMVIGVEAQANITPLEKTDKAIKEVSKDSQKLSDIAKHASKSVKKAHDRLRELTKGAKEASKATSLLQTIFKKGLGLVGFTGFKDMFTGYLQFEKDLGAMHSRFYAITGDAQKAGEEFEYIKNLAVETANDIKSTADSYSIFYASARNALGQEGARGVFESWTKIGRVLHLNEGQFERVTYALREMSSKGQLYASDLKMQLGTHVPDAVNIAETAIQNMGIKGVDTVEKFQELTKKGKSRELMAKFLMEFSQEAERRYASPEAVKKAMEQPDALQQRLVNLWQEFLIDFSRKGGNEALVKLLKGFYNMVANIPWDNIATAMGVTAKIVSSILDFLFKMHTFLSRTLLAILAVSIGRSVSRGFGELSLLKTAISRAKDKKSLFALLPFLKGSHGALAQSIAKGFFVKPSANTAQGLFKGIAMSKGLGFLLGAKNIFSLLLKFMGGPWGILLSIIISFLPEIFKIVSKIWNHFTKDKTPVSEQAKNLLAGYGVNDEQLQTTLGILNSKVKEGNIENVDDLKRIVAQTITSKEAQNMFTLNDKSEIIIKVEGVGEVLATDIINTPDSNVKGSRFSNKPKVTSKSYFDR